MSNPIRIRCSFVAASTLLLLLVSCGDQGERSPVTIKSPGGDGAADIASATANAFFWGSFSTRTVVLVNDKRRLLQALDGVGGQVVVIRMVGLANTPTNVVGDLFELRNHQAFLAACHLAANDRSPSDALFVMQELRGLGVQSIQVDDSEALNVKDVEAVFARIIEGRASKDEVENVKRHGDEAARLMALYVPNSPPPSK